MDQTDEIARMLHLLDEHRSRGEYVLHSARMVGDEEDHAIWKQSRNAWAEAAVSTLATCLGGGELRSLQLAGQSSASAGWKVQYEAELRSVNANLISIADASETIRRRQISTRARARAR